MGLLKPVKVDAFTGYRYYDYDQFASPERILALKDLGFSFEEIGQLLAGNLTLEQLRGMLKLRQVEARQRVREEMERLERVEARLRQIEQEDAMSKYDVVIKKIEPVQVASIRDIVPTPPEQGTLWNELGRYLAMQRVRSTGAPCLTLYYDEEYKERDWDLEVCEPIDAGLPESQRVKTRTLPAVETNGLHAPPRAVRYPQRSLSGHRQVDQTLTATVSAAPSGRFTSAPLRMPAAEPARPIPTP